ncbi:MAG: hypothetical protein O7E52_13070 [Candidatus Poribacteria bacterium]|nr:hypothetical protein [Candidatus Poribacteria bacterium]
MEKIATALIFIGAIIWGYSILFMEARWKPQMLSAAILITGIVIAHVWEELFREKR